MSETNFVQILGAIDDVLRVSKPKTEMPIIGSNRSCSKTDCRRIKFSNLEPPGNAVSELPHLIFLNSDFLFFFLLSVFYFYFYFENLATIFFFLL